LKKKTLFILLLFAIIIFGSLLTIAIAQSLATEKTTPQIQNTKALQLINGDPTNNPCGPGSGGGGGGPPNET
jgi:hypothetical protein